MPPLKAWEWDKYCLLEGAKRSTWGCESLAGHTGTWQGGERAYPPCRQLRPQGRGRVCGSRAGAWPSKPTGEEAASSPSLAPGTGWNWHSFSRAEPERLKPGEGLVEDLRQSWSPHHLKHPRGPLKACWQPAAVGASQVQLAQLGGGQRLPDEPSVLKKQHPPTVRNVRLSLTHGTSSDLIPAPAPRGGAVLSPFTEEAVRPGAAKAVAQGS